MPVYLRKNVSYTPSSLYNMELEDDNDYLLDPDQMRDILPQPYRMINKIIFQILDTVWETVAVKEESHLNNAPRVPPPKFDKPIKLPDFTNATALSASNDGNFIFLGLPNRLVVLDAFTKDIIYTWEEQHAEIISIKSYVIGSNCLLLTTIDDLGPCRLFLFACNILFLLKPIHENAPQAEVKILCHKCEASQHGEYIGVVLENTGKNDIWLEIYKSPLDNWEKEFEAFSTALMQAVNHNIFKTYIIIIITSEYPAMPLKERKLMVLAINVHLCYNHQKSQSLNQRMASIQSAKPETAVPYQSLVKHSLKTSDFQYCIVELSTSTLMALLLSSAATVLPPAPVSSKSDTTEQLGMGLNHVLGATHLEKRNAMFTHRHENLIKYLEEEKDEMIMSPSFHFLPASRLIPSSLDQAVSNDTLVSVAVWWTNHPSLIHYSLLKPGKEGEGKPELIWPFTSCITSTAVSVCSTYMAIGLDKGNIILWNRQMGLSKAVLSGPECQVKSLRFLDPDLFPMTQTSQLSNSFFTSMFLLAEFANGTQWLFDTLHGSEQIPRCIASEPEKDDQMQTILDIFPEVPELILFVEKGGALFIKDVCSGSLVCQIDLPPTHKLQTPWNPILTLAGGGHVLLVKAEGTEVSDDGEVSDVSGVFLYNLRSYPALGRYWNQEIEKPSQCVPAKKVKPTV
ncbi:unnamed protein product [Lymnaea stagnalis]|uniref:WD repeat-containing protein 93 n=1 Tax=Lymnaea stagnalis TaxID=6523 RepID=A0AAV2HPK5_LYMST